MPRHRGIRFQQWRTCDVCAFIWPIGQLTMQQGLLRCPRDIDNLDVEVRPLVIAEILGDDNESENDMQHVGMDDAGLIEF